MVELSGIVESESSSRWMKILAAGVVAVVVGVGCSSDDGDDGDDGSSDSGVETEIVTRCGAGSSSGGDVGPGDAGNSMDGGDIDAAVPADTGPDADAGEPAPDAGGTTYPPLPDSFSYESEYSLRFTDFQFAESSAGSSVNSIISGFFDQSREYPIVVLTFFRNFNSQAGTVELRGGAGVKVDKECNPEERPDGECNYDWDPETPERYREIPLDPETGKLEGGLESLKFVARTQVGDELSVTTLTIRDLVFTDAALRPVEEGSDEVGIDSGILEGYITYEDAEDATVNVGGTLIPVSDLLKRDRLNYDANGDGELNAWCMQGSFSARETNIIE